MLQRRCYSHCLLQAHPFHLLRHHKMSTRRARGHYSPLICTRCRARKIKCFLPASVISPSTAPQTLNQACQRCRQNGWECFVEYTVLGRPGSPRIGGTNRDIRPSQIPIVDDGKGEAELGIRGFLLSQPYDVGMEKNRIRAEEVCEALSSPLRFLSVLLSRHPTFGRDIGLCGSWTRPVKLDQVISLSIQESLESKLVWHRIHHPYIPTLESLRDRLQSSLVDHSSIALYALLCLLASGTTSNHLPTTTTRVKSLECALYHYGQATLIKPPAHRDTVTFFQLLAEYRPLALVGSPIAAVSALADSSYLTLAVKIAKEIEMDQSWNYIDNGNSLLETLQWLHLFLTQGYSSFVMGKSDIRRDWLAEVQPMIHTLDSLVRSGGIPTKALHLTINILLVVRSAEARHQMVLSWRDLDRLKAIVQSHHSASGELRHSFEEILCGNDDRNGNQVYVLTTILDAELHQHRLMVKQSAMLFAVMAATYLRERAQFDPSEITQLGEHIINHLKIPLDMNQVHAFMAEFGATTVDELEKQARDLAELCDLRLDDVTYVPPTKTAASEILHTAYLLVQQNAARLKGWGGLHDRVDTHITVMDECANRLDALASQEGAEGRICSATASLVRDLKGILAEWRKRLSNPTAIGSEEATSAGPSTTSASQSIDSPSPTSTPIPRPRHTVFNQPGSWATDMFATWEMWPQPEEIDFSQFIDFDYDPSAEHNI